MLLLKQFDKCPETKDECSVQHGSEQSLNYLFVWKRAFINIICLCIACTYIIRVNRIALNRFDVHSRNYRCSS